MIAGGDKVYFACRKYQVVKESLKWGHDGLRFYRYPEQKEMCEVGYTERQARDRLANVIKGKDLWPPISPVDIKTSDSLLSRLKAWLAQW